MQKAVFQHFGVPTRAKSPGETYMAAMKLYLTDPAKHPYSIEFLRFEPGSPLPKAIQTTPHVAYSVPNLEAAIKGKQVVLEPTPVGEDMRIAFIKDGDALIEVMEIKS